MVYQERVERCEGLQGKQQGAKPLQWARACLILLVCTLVLGTSAQGAEKERGETDLLLATYNCQPPSPPPALPVGSSSLSFNGILGPSLGGPVSCPGLRPATQADCDKQAQAVKAIAEAGGCTTFVIPPPPPPFLPVGVQLSICTGDHNALVEMIATLCERILTPDQQH